MRLRHLAFLAVCLALMPGSSAAAAVRAPKAVTLGAESFLPGEEMLFGDVKTYGI